MLFYYDILRQAMFHVHVLNNNEERTNGIFIIGNKIYNSIMAGTLLICK